MKDFNSLWQFITIRPGVMTVQNREELEYIYNLVVESNSQHYLEIGSAEGNSLYVIGHALQPHSIIQYVDYGEKHTEQPRRRMLNELKAHGCYIQEFLGDSTNPNTFTPTIEKPEIVMIDGGHDYSTVLSDAMMYAPLATKYVFFHDIQMPEVKAAVEWFVKRWNLGEYSTFINSENFGYGIIKVKR